MRSRLHLKIDLAGQFLLLLAFIGFSIYSLLILHPGTILIWFMLLLLGLGLWQFTNGLIAATAFRNSLYGKYIAASIFYFGCLFMVNFWYANHFSNNLVSNNSYIEYIYYFTLLVPPTGLAIWYSRRSWLDYKYHTPRSFWDYEF